MPSDVFEECGWPLIDQLVLRVYEVRQLAMTAATAHNICFNELGFQEVA